VFKRYSNKHFSRSYEEQLLREAENLGVKDSVRIIEEVPYKKMPEIYAFADVVINYPLADGFPVSFLEASACEKPVITGRHPSYLGTFAERYYRIVDLEDIDDLTKAIIEIMNIDHNQLNESLKAARNEVLQHYDEIICANKLMNIYDQIVLETQTV
jgi:glycosyltransferase involved in cell wall biosynthesis